jgi:hypothetical protein
MIMEGKLERKSSAEVHVVTGKKRDGKIIV